jgi:hypothetical protein
MSENKILTDMISEVLVIPLYSGEIDVLQKACKQYETSITFDKMECCVLSFVTKTPNEDLIDSLITIEKDFTDDTINISPIVSIILSEYICYIITREDPDIAKNSAICSLMVMNSMVLNKGKYDSLFSPSRIIDMYHKYDLYRDVQVSSISQNDTDISFIPRIFYSVKSVDELSEDEEVDLISEIKVIAKESCLYKYELILKDILKKQINDVFEYVYYAIYTMINEIAWVYLEVNPINTIYRIAEKTSTQKVKLASILQAIRKSEHYIQYTPNSRSSIILNMLVQENLYGAPILQKTFSPVEFAIYLYNEFILEKLREEGNDNE